MDFVELEQEDEREDELESCYYLQQEEKVEQLKWVFEGAFDVALLLQVQELLLSLHKMENMVVQVVVDYMDVVSMAVD